MPKPQGPVLGVLEVMSFNDGSHGKPVLRAQLVGTDGQGVLPILLHARIGRVQGAWLTVAGTEHVSRGGSKGMMEHYPQTWWCRVESEWPAVEAPKAKASVAQPAPAPIPAPPPFVRPAADDEDWCSRAANVFEAEPLATPKGATLGDVPRWSI